MAIRDWQIWNEPNLSSYWSRQPVRAVLRGAAQGFGRTLRRADPRGAESCSAVFPTRAGSLCGASTGPGGRGSFDAVAIHPYTGTPSRVLKIVELNRREMRRAGDGRAGIWLTELSWPSTCASRSIRRGSRPRREPGHPPAETVRRLAAARRRLRIERVSGTRG
jgi:hypothetical protein